ncbi:hypothetical protein CCHR01_00594 [Colletotrichum chrysophilum]|uniref:Uncharacterized protein n=1 Tax=Colletotrichum chrysophilum TaxID=1836956 RepID=A0AAD9EU82_9PEZI|nr:hypothetical protein CCHR01_00594 [Colletotrichum chrysophilum]
MEPTNIGREGASPHSGRQVTSASERRAWHRQRGVGTSNLHGKALTSLEGFGLLQGFSRTTHTILSTHAAFLLPRLPDSTVVHHFFTERQSIAICPPAARHFLPSTAMPYFSTPFPSVSSHPSPDHTVPSFP